MDVTTGHGGSAACTRQSPRAASAQAGDRPGAALQGAGLFCEKAYLPCADCSTGFCMVEMTRLFTREPPVTFWSGAAAVAMASW
jgi:hypothetical protein